MKKRVVKGILLSAVMGILLLFGVACEEPPVKLDTPQVTLTDNIAQWEENPLADKFEISLDGTLSYKENSTTSMVLEEGQTFKIRAIGDGSSYLNSDWSNKVVYQSPSAQSYYTVTWKNGETILEIDGRVAEGAIPTYDGELPVKDGTDKFEYQFIGWDAELAPINGNITYTAQFEQVLRKFNVIFYDDDGATVLETCVVKYGETAIYSKGTPQKESTAQFNFSFVKWVTIVGGEQEANLNAITQDLSVYASYSSSIRTYSIKFLDQDGTLLKEELVNYGESATAPGEQPEVDGYLTPSIKGFRFLGWDKEFDFIEGEITVTAQYVSQFTVTFYDYDGTMINVQLVDLNKGAILPEEPKRDGFTFKDWGEADLANVTQDLTVTAQYLENFMVKFVHYNGSILDEQVVPYGMSAREPTQPERTGYTFQEWDKPFDAVVEDLTIYAQFEINKYTVKFVDYDYDESSNHHAVFSEEIVEYGDSATAPTSPNNFVNWQLSTPKAYEFLEWDKDFSSVTDHLTVRAVYIEKIEPVFAVRVERMPSGSVAEYHASVYLLNSPNVYGMQISATLDSRLTLVSVSGDPVFGQATEKIDGKWEGDYSINSANNQIEFVWSNKIPVSGAPIVLHLYFNCPANTEEETYAIQVSYEGNAIIGENLQVIFPEIMQCEVKQSLEATV